MYTLPWMRFNQRVRRLVWRLDSPKKSYAVWIGSTVVSLAALRHFVSSATSSDTYRRRMDADASYKKRRFAETDDNPIYRLPENPQGGHKLDGTTAWSSKAAKFVHH